MVGFSQNLPSNLTRLASGAISPPDAAFSHEDLFLRQLSLGRRQGGVPRSGRSLDLPLQPARQRPAHHEHRWRQHVVQAAGEGSADGSDGGSPLGEGFGRRSAHEHAGELLLALPGKVDRDAGVVWVPRGQGTEVTGGGRHGGDVRAHHVQPESAGFVDRHAAALVSAGAACGSHAPERDHLDRGIRAV